MAITAMLVPFPALSGLYLNQNDQRGLGQQLWMLAAAELPVSEDCAFGCPPTVPTSPITGIRAVDSSPLDRGDTDRSGEISAPQQLF